MDHKVDKTLKIGIALGSGSARGWAHIGVLDALKDMGIEPEIVAGCSIGAFVGAAYASEQLDVLEEWSKTLTWQEIIGFFDVSLSKGGLIQGEKLFKFIREKAGDPDISSLSKKFGAVATELNTGREVWLRDGLLFESVRASVAFPGLIAPSKYHNKWLIDGGLINPVPVSLCRAMGADVVIAVNLNGDLMKSTPKTEEFNPVETELSTDDESSFFERLSTPLKLEINKQKNFFTSKFFNQNVKSPGTFEVMASSINIMQDRITRSRMAGDVPEIIISPKLSQLGLLEFDKAKLAIEEGHASVERARHVIEDVLFESYQP
ncbi:MAG: patatin-like phospholipase RssA [Colwellia sp.]